MIFPSPLLLPPYHLSCIPPARSGLFGIPIILFIYFPHSTSHLHLYSLGIPLSLCLPILRFISFKSKIQNNIYFLIGRGREKGSEGFLLTSNNNPIEKIDIHKKNDEWLYFQPWTWDESAYEEKVNISTVLLCQNMTITNRQGTWACLVPFIIFLWLLH